MRMKTVLIGCMLALVLCLVAQFSACSRITAPNTTVDTTSEALAVNGTVSQSDSSETSEETLPPETTAPVTDDSITLPPTTEEKPYTTIAVPSSEMYTGSLIVVDRENPYSYRVASMYTPSELDRLSEGELSELGWVSLYANKGTSYVLRSRLIYLRAEAYRAFSQMMSDYVAKSGNRDVQVRFGYQLINGIADLASLSDERVTGLTVEINVYTEEGSFSIDHASKKSAYFDWFSANCHKYGFVMTAESGMFRYVGTPHASYMQANSLTLSEYVALVSRRSFEEPLSFVDASGVLWRVYGVAVQSGSVTAIPVRNDSVYMISGNNKNGFIIASRDK
ncbi:MAG: hypothetical protein IJW46_02105 [Clostridia bacterium]|nr:hypothetical protein [Clostridia bacterium]